MTTNVLADVDTPPVHALYNRAVTLRLVLAPRTVATCVPAHPPVIGGTLP